MIAFVALIVAGSLLAEAKQPGPKPVPRLPNWDNRFG